MQLTISNNLNVHPKVSWLTIKIIMPEIMETLICTSFDLHFIVEELFIIEFFKYSTSERGLIDSII